jgi:hypothetical protein
LKPDLFEQHAKLKSQYPDVLLLLRVGDFWEAFDDDADTIARVLSLAKTTRGQRRMSAGNRALSGRAAVGGRGGQVGNRRRDGSRRADRLAPRAMGRTKARPARLCPGDGMRRAQRTGSLCGLEDAAGVDGCSSGGSGPLTVAHISPS